MIFCKYLLLAAMLHRNFGGIGKAKAESEVTFEIKKNPNIKIFGLKNAFFLIFVMIFHKKCT